MTNLFFSQFFFCFKFLQTVNCFGWSHRSESKWKCVCGHVHKRFNGQRWSAVLSELPDNDVPTGHTHAHKKSYPKKPSKKQRSPTYIPVESKKAVRLGKTNSGRVRSQSIRVSLPCQSCAEFLGCSCHSYPQVPGRFWMSWLSNNRKSKTWSRRANYSEPVSNASAVKLADSKSFESAQTNESQSFVSIHCQMMLHREMLPTLNSTKWPRWQEESQLCCRR